MQAYELRLPSVEPRGMTVKDQALVARLRTCDRRYRHIEDSFGLELKTAWAMVENGAAWRFANGGPHDEPPNLKRFLLRPAAEPVLASWWSRLAGLDLDLESSVALASSLNGAKLELSPHRMRTRGSEAQGHIWYAELEEARRFLVDIQAVEGRLESPIERALYRFVKTLQAHPLADGNGRVARALLLGALAGDSAISGPILPLGPIYYRNSDLVTRQIRDLSESGDWGRYFSEATQLIETALAAAETWAPA